MLESAQMILLLDDDENDVFMMRRAWTKAGNGNSLFILRDGQEAIDYMAGSEPFSNRSIYPLPAIIILDIKMPRKNGLEFLEWLRIQPRLRTIPAILLSSSEEESDVSRAYELGANAYFAKPSEFSGLVELVKVVQEYWRRALLPTLSGGVGMRHPPREPVIATTLSASGAEILSQPAAKKAAASPGSQHDAP